MDWTVGLAAFASVGLAIYLTLALLKPELFG